MRWKNVFHSVCRTPFLCISILHSANDALAVSSLPIPKSSNPLPRTKRITPPSQRATAPAATTNTGNKHFSKRKLLYCGFYNQRNSALQVPFRQKQSHSPHICLSRSIGDYHHVLLFWYVYATMFFFSAGKVISLFCSTLNPLLPLT